MLSLIRVLRLLFQFDLQNMDLIELRIQDACELHLLAFKAMD